MDIFVANEQEISVDEKRSSALARHTLDAEEIGDEAELSVLYVTADHIRRLNARYANNDHPTDVLAFPLMEEEDEEDEDLVLGDVVICPHVAQENAGRLGHDLTHELDTLLVHGTLHLLGYDHNDAEGKERMDGRLRSILDSFGLRSEP